MKTVISIVLILATVHIFAGGKTFTGSNREMMSQIAMKMYGGKIRQPRTENGSIVFVNKQTMFDKSVINKIAAMLERRFRYILEISSVDQEGASDKFIIKLEDIDRKERILLAPENFWVSVNVRRLKDGVVPKPILEDRFVKEVLRAFAFVCGGTCGTEPGGICQLISNASDLDAIPGLDYSIDIEARIINNMNKSDVRPYRIAKYSEAVLEGWAPAPTNDAQRAIWDKVHAIPKTPMRIEFDPKKGR